MEHGGNVAQAAQHYRIPVNEWLDLSTGVNPSAYPVTLPDPRQLSMLPYDDQVLQKIACEYYQCAKLVTLNGTQQAIQLLPLLRDKSRVAVVSPTYSEHARCWQHAGHHVAEVTDLDEIDEYDVVVVTNPNNPTGEHYTREQLLAVHQQLQRRSGWLVVDEAFMDVEPSLSLTSDADRTGLIVLRSLGKFFGLPGLRIGFVVGDKETTDLVEKHTGPWTVNSFSSSIASTCLSDTGWQQQARQQIHQNNEQLKQLLIRYNLPVSGHTGLFVWSEHEEAGDIHDALAGMGILLRYFPANFRFRSSLRFGLPGSEADFARLEHTLKLVL